MRFIALTSRIVGLIAASHLFLLTPTRTTGAFFVSTGPVRTQKCRSPGRLPGLLVAAQQRKPSEDVDLDDLRPPDLNLARDSILFGDNPSTKKNNSIRTFWQRTKSVLPKIITGAWNNNLGEENPVGALYNMVLVRLPVLLAFLVYVKNTVQGHPFVVDFGNGPFEPNPVVLMGLLYLLLGPVLVD